MTAVAKPRLTPAEYYRLERAAIYKSDYYAGETYDMSGGTIRHSRIASNLIRNVGSRLEGTACETFESNLRLCIMANGLRCYPDVSVYCSPLEFDPEDSTGETVTNPTVLFEVLSPSTEGYNQGLKARSFRQIPSLKAYVLVSQEAPEIEVFHRQSDGSWSLREAKGLDGELLIPEVKLALPMKEIYARVEFTDAPSLVL